MSTAALDRLLAVLLVAGLATGLLTLRAGVPATAPLFWVHGVLAGSLLIAAVDRTIDGCSVLVMRDDTSDVRPVPGPKEHRLMPAR